MLDGEPAEPTDPVVLTELVRAIWQGLSTRAELGSAREELLAVARFAVALLRQANGYEVVIANSQGPKSFGRSSPGGDRRGPQTPPDIPDGAGVLLCRRHAAHRRRHARRL